MLTDLYSSSLLQKYIPRQGNTKNLSFDIKNLLAVHDKCCLNNMYKYRISKFFTVTSYYIEFNDM